MRLAEPLNSWAHPVIEGEDLAGHHHSAIQALGHQAQVVGAVAVARVEASGEAGQRHLDLGEVLGGHVRRHDPHRQLNPGFRPLPRRPLLESRDKRGLV
jgi:hypothetical protein